VRVQQEQKLRGLADDLSQALGPLLQSGEVRLMDTARGLAVEISSSVLFAPAQANLQPGSIAALQNVAQVLRSVENPIEVQGHTDKLPISTAQFPSNWELASARASAVVRLFLTSGLAPDRLAAIGYADNRPVEAGDSPEARARNRRVTLLILTDGATGNDRPLNPGSPAASPVASAAASAAASPATSPAASPAATSAASPAASPATSPVSSPVSRP
jgi:flagellar motor protein MotB